ncbi:MAG: DUF4838 domain-containing protein [Treponema sp.]|nr:DUF4838 domain-containing protein [Treponema sp.]
MKQLRKRLFISKRTGAGERDKMIKLAIENECNTLVFSLDDSYFKNRSKNTKYIKLIKNYGLFIEAGGRNFPLLMPKKLFFFNRELFRMERGRRRASHHFCPTNPKTTAIIAENAAVWIERVIEGVTQPRVFHLLPDEGRETTWCACPACRAFSPAEQYLIAVNTTADVLAKYDHEAMLAYVDFDTEPEAEGISPRKNVMVCK